MTLPGAVRALLGRQDAAPEPAAHPAPTEHPARHLLAALNAPDFETLQELAEQRQAVGLPAGAVDVVLNSCGQPAGMRPRRYRSAIEGEVDRRIQDMADRLQTERDAGERERLAGRLDVAKRYQALAGLWDLENRLSALPPAPKPRRALAAPERPSAAVSREPVPSQATAVGFDANIRGLNAQRADVLRDRRAFEVARFDARQEAQARALAVPSTDEDVDALRVRLEARLTSNGPPRMPGLSRSCGALADDPGDNDPLRERRKRRAQAARIRRAAKRAGQEQAWRATQATGGDVAVLHAPPSLLLATHVRRTAAFLERLEADETCSLSERTRIFVAAVPALARACEATEFRERLEDLERRVGGGLHPRRGVA